MSSSNHHSTSIKYFTFFFWNNAEKIVISALKHGRFIFEPTYSENIHRLIRNVNRVYFLIANIESHQIEAIIKLTDYKNDIMKFEHKTKCNISFSEIEEAKEFKNKDVTILQRKLDVIYLPVFEAEVSEVNEKEIEMFEDIREIMKEKYRQNKKQQETLATYDKIKNTPLMYQLLNYHQMCYAVQKQLNNNQQGQLASVFQIPGMLNYYQNGGIYDYVISNQLGKGTGNNSNSDYNRFNSQSQSNEVINNNEPRERYFDLKELASYNELERRLRKDPKDNTSFYLVSNQPEASTSSTAQIGKKHSKEKHQEKRLSRSRSSHINKNSKTKTNTSFNKSDSEEGFYAKKMMNQNKKSKYQYSTHNNIGNNINTKHQGYQQQQQQGSISNTFYQDQSQSQSQQKRPPPLTYQEPPSYKTQHNSQYSFNNNSNGSTSQSKSSKITPLNTTRSDVKVIDMSNRKKIILNRDKNQPEIKINFSNKYYK